MKKIFTLLFVIIGCPFLVNAQNNIGIGTATPDASAALDISAVNQGVRIPGVKLTATSTAAPIVNPAMSLLVFNTNTQNDVIPGYYYWDGNKWVHLFSDNSVPVASVSVTAPIVNTGTATNPIIGINTTNLNGSGVVSVTNGNNQVVGNGSAGIDVKGISGGLLYGTGTSSAFNAQGTAGQVLKSGGAAAPLWNTPTDVTGSTVVSVTNGTGQAVGTGNESIDVKGASGSVLYGTGASSAFNAAGTTGQILQSNGLAAPSWVAPNSTLTTANILPVATSAVVVNNGTGQVVGPGNVSIDVEGTQNGVFYGTGPGTPAIFGSASTGANQVLATPVSGGVPVWVDPNTTLTTSDVTGSPIVTVTGGTNKVVGAGGVNVDVRGTQGGVLYGNGAAASAAFTGAGTTGQLLQSNGTGAPTWVAPNNAITTSDLNGSTVVTVGNGTGKVVGAGNATVDVTGAAGALLYGTGTSSSFNTPGTSGQLLKSGGAGSPTWNTPSNLTGSTVVAVTNGTGQVAGPVNAGVDVVGTAGTVLYGTGTSSAFTAAGTSGQLFKSNGAGAPTWNTPSNLTGSSVVTVTNGTGQVAGPANAGVDVVGTAGTVLYGTGTSSAFSTTGTAGQLLQSNGAGAPTWVSPNSAVTTSNLTGSTVLTVTNGTGKVVGAGNAGVDVVGALGAVLYGTGTSSSFTAAGTSGQVLKSNGAAAPTWVAANTTLTTSNVTSPGAVVIGNGTGQVVGASNLTVDVQGTNGGVFYGNGAGTSAAFSAAGTSGQILKSNGAAAPTWVAPNTTLTTSSVTSPGVIVVGNGTGQVVGASNLTVDVQGTSGGVLYGNGAGTSATFSTAGTAGQVLQSNGSGAPTWTTLPAGWNLTGNAGTTPGTNFLGTTDAQPLMFKVNGTEAGYISYSNTDQNTGLGYGTLASNTGTLNTAEGYQALNVNTSGSFNTAAGSVALAANTTGGYNTGNGYAALKKNTTGGYNTADGAQALYNNTTGANNTAGGVSALFSNTSGSNNVANGYNTLNYNTTGSNNVAVGNSALQQNTTANNNIAVGSFALNTNTTGSNNLAAGYFSLFANTTGIQNTAVGYRALASNTTANNNTAVGNQVLENNTTGVGNAGIGLNALNLNTTGQNNTASGSNALDHNTTGGGNNATGHSALSANTTGSNNVADGFQALSANTTNSNNTAIGHLALTNNTTDGNVGVGYESFYSNTTGNHETGLGYKAGYANTTAINTTAIGYMTLSSNTTGNANTGAGDEVLVLNTTGTGNTATGDGAMYGNTTGSYNVASGYFTLTNNTTGGNNTALGSQALSVNTTGSANVTLGSQAMFTNTTNSNNVAVGNQALYNNTQDGNVAIGYQAAYGNTTGSQNTATGYKALFANTTGGQNTAAGFQALQSNTTGFANTANGNMALLANTTGNNNSAQGYHALAANTTGSGNTANGYLALAANTTAGANTAMGYDALYTNTTGFNNTGLGYQALASNTTGSHNSATGINALYVNSTGSNNAAFGESALAANTTGSNNIALGTSALALNVTNNNNTAVGHQALLNNIADNNTALGYQALGQSTTGDNNVALGVQALLHNTTGYANFACGTAALANNTTGIADCAVGYLTLISNTTGIYNASYGPQNMYSNTTGNQNTAIGGLNTLNGNTTGSNNSAVGTATLGTNTTGGGNSALGAFADVASGNLSNATAIGYTASVDASNKVLLGNTSVSSIGGQVGFTTYSDARVKNNVQTNVPGLAFITALRPVTYHYDIDKENQLLGVKTDTAGEMPNGAAAGLKALKAKKPSDWEGKYDIEKMTFSGFLAQEVDATAQKIGYDFSGVDKSGKLLGIRYSDFVPSLVKSVQELNTKLEEKETFVQKLQSEVDELKKQVQELMQAKKMSDH